MTILKRTCSQFVASYDEVSIVPVIDQTVFRSFELLLHFSVSIMYEAYRYAKPAAIPGQYLQVIEGHISRASKISMDLSRCMALGDWYAVTCRQFTHGQRTEINSSTALPALLA
jgi:hypothetical protein